MHFGLYAVPWSFVRMQWRPVWVVLGTVPSKIGDINEKGDSYGMKQQAFFLINQWFCSIDSVQMIYIPGQHSP